MYGYNTPPPYSSGHPNAPHYPISKTPIATHFTALQNKNLLQEEAKRTK